MSGMKKRFPEIYSTYALSYFCSMFMPHFVNNFTVNYTTKPATLAFSNTPGLLKPLDLGNGRRSYRMTPYI